MLNKSLYICLVMLLVSGFASAQSFDTPGSVEVVPENPGAHWMWISSGGGTAGGKISLMDVGSDKYYGLISITGNIAPVFSLDNRHIYVSETFRSRGTRGDRTDVVTVFDTSTLKPVDEIGIPPRKASMLTSTGASALSNDGRFLSVFNLTPATSISILDMEKREFIGEITTPGCSLIFPAGERRFAMICSNGALLVVTLDTEGREQSKEQTEVFFDLAADPVSDRAIIYDDKLLTVSYNGIVHTVDLSRREPRFLDTWDLFNEEDKAEGWQIAGKQHLSVHEDSNRLYSLVHKRNEKTSGDPAAETGEEVWVYDLTRHQRLQRIKVTNVNIGAALRPLGIEVASFGATELTAWVREHPEGAATIKVTQGDNPLLVIGSDGVVAVHDAMSGEFLHNLSMMSGGDFFAPRAGR
jgi:methylamine dehydrogenase heavy chain